ncbi:response regulator transcription factor [Terasakiella sp. A23]|uniref:response regulator transcription factor n=1 Tax=Terasakiella sp. FCG-A23 TaxID=3080561 RepID=UPI002955A8C7|nr:response regulator transcription factor [Terasakiella sp. A23]MDV7340224.1 response regulator transcription factor [Terasakiella sp. A23]
MRVLVVEDNIALADGIASALAQLDLAVDVLGDGVEADEVLRTQDYDVVVLDLNLPGCDGLEVLRNLRARQTNTQVLILTARDQIEDRVQGLDLGADDYLTKPFELIELEARIRALLRRVSGHKSPVVQVGKLQFNTVSRLAQVDGQVLDLPKREFCLLELFVAKIGQVISKEQIADGLANFDDEITPNAVELYISRLRKKLKETGLNIKTVRGLGYLLEKP